MNVNELASSVYGNYHTQINKTSLAKMQSTKETDGESFSDLLTSIVAEKEASPSEVKEVISELSDSFIESSSDENDSVKVLDLLTDAQKAKEYLSSQSGRTLLFSMAEREISSIVTGSNN